MDSAIAIVNRANQRGGRMLSIVDLLLAETLTLPQAAWLAAQVLGGRSFLVGARPGGAGKTTVMGALLGLLPRNEPVLLAARGTGWESAAPGSCVVAYEIGRGHYEAYVWGERLVQLTALRQRGCRIVTNLHADTLAEARAQIVEDCGAGERGLAAFETFIPIETRGRGYSMQRRVGTMQWHDGADWRPWEPVTEPSPREKACSAFLARCLEQGTRTLEAVRSAWLAADIR